jgi:hypothetical protein
LNIARKRNENQSPTPFSTRTKIPLPKHRIVTLLGLFHAWRERIALKWDDMVPGNKPEIETENLITSFDCLFRENLIL